MNDHCDQLRRELPFFRFFLESELELLGNFFRCRRVEEVGASLWREGDPCDYLAFVLRGRVELKQATEFAGKDVVVGVYSRGAVVGELCILDRSPRCDSVVVLEPVELMELATTDFERLLELHPSLGVKLLKGILLVVSHRLKKSYERLAAIF